MEACVAINTVGNMVVVHMDNPKEREIKDRLQDLLMLDINPDSVVIFDELGYRVFERTTDSLDMAWTSALSF